MPESRFTLAPADTHNIALSDNVHPSDWTNPTPKGRYHLVVVGGGTAGLVSAAGAAGLGARVALIERNLLGGDCLNVGCVPSKGIISAARAWKTARTAAPDFGGPTVSGDGDFAFAMERMRRLRAGIGPHDSAARFRDLGIDVYFGSGTFTGDDSIEVEGQRLSFRRAVIATGARASALPIPGLAEAGFHTNETIFSLTELPKRLAVIGAGPIGCELAQAFARLGSQVTLLDRSPHILPREDPDAAAVVSTALGCDGVDFLGDSSILRVEKTASGRRVHFRRDESEDSVEIDELLVAIGRTPNVDGLGLEVASVDFDPRKGVAVNERLQTTNKRIYACGDIASRYQFTHAADAQARIVIQNALFYGRAQADKLIIPWCTYTSPEIAHVGLYPHEAASKGIEIDTVRVDMSEVDRAILDGENDGFLAVHLKKGKDEILGATLVASHAGDLISEVVLAMTAGIGLGKIASVIHPYPTQGEVLKKAADTWRRTKLTPTVRRIFQYWFRATG
ncbi:MAG: pyruvate/2-oxoglutarate dehydrogenase complex dihydrolipoamide dehydrogenase (E3) component [Hyphomicrobiaceae bacterium]|jgi:pyruvate/2-oxoglutarate dehydrogenase complex dihydrolipoamide dehydrogenase (E3) component